MNASATAPLRVDLANALVGLAAVLAIVVFLAVYVTVMVRLTPGLQRSLEGKIPLSLSGRLFAGTLVGLAEVVLVFLVVGLASDDPLPLLLAGSLIIAVTAAMAFLIHRLWLRKLA